MKVMEPVNIGIIGLGTVGAGTVNLLERNANEISRRAGRHIKVKGAAVRDAARPRACSTSSLELGTDPFELTDDPTIDVIVELMGGETLAREIVIRALTNGKHVVTANKALIAVHGNEIFRVARENGLVVALYRLSNDVPRNEIRNGIHVTRARCIGRARQRNGHGQPSRPAGKRT